MRFLALLQSPDRNGITGPVLKLEALTMQHIFSILSERFPPRPGDGVYTISVWPDPEPVNPLAKGK